MHPDLIKHLQIYRQKLNFNPKEWINLKVKLLNDYFRQNHLNCCVIGCSGGIDSSVTLALCIKAMSELDSPIQKVIPVLLPMNQENSSTCSRALELCQKFQLNPVLVEIKNSVDLVSETLLKALDDNNQSLDQFAYGQLQSYLRTPYLYYTAQVMSSRGFPAVVMGTGNKDEDGYLAYFCKAGDGVVDVQLINDLHKSQVFQVGAELEVPESILKAAPTADLWENQTDEEELGFSYDFVELLTGYFFPMNAVEQIYFLEGLSLEAQEEFIDNQARCNQVHLRNRHKLDGVVNL